MEEVEWAQGELSSRGLTSWREHYSFTEYLLSSCCGLIVVLGAETTSVMKRLTSLRELNMSNFACLGVS